MGSQWPMAQVPPWLRPSFTRTDAVCRAEQLQPGLRVLSATPIGYPYALFQFAWERRGWRSQHTESLFCLVDRCQGISASLEAAPLTQAPENIICPPACFDVMALENVARRQAMQVQRGRLRRRGHMSLVDKREVLKPLWRIGAELPGYDNVTLLIDGLSGGYYLLEDAE